MFKIVHSAEINSDKMTTTNILLNTWHHMINNWRLHHQTWQYSFTCCLCCTGHTQGQSHNKIPNNMLQAKTIQHFLHISSISYKYCAVILYLFKYTNLQTYIQHRTILINDNGIYTSAINN